jgi:hypothetical protein
LARLDSDQSFLDALVDDADEALRGYCLGDGDIPTLVAYLRGRNAAITEPQHRRVHAAATFLILARLGHSAPDRGDKR